MFFSSKQKAIKTFDTYLSSLKKLASYCEFAQLEDKLFRDRIV